MRGIVVHRFGPCDVDLTRGHLFRGDKRIPLSSPQSAILCYLVRHPGVIVSREALIVAGWEGASISDNSLNKAISHLRQTLGDDGRYIETVPHQGYRFTVTVEQAYRDLGEPSLDAQLAPYLSFANARAELESLERDGVQRARHDLEHVVREAPDYTAARVALATACGLAYEATTLDTTPDTTALESGIHHAREACTRAPASGEAWSSLAFLLRLRGEAKEAAAAARKAMDADPNNLRLALRAAYASWGEERLYAAGHALTLRPSLAIGHWFRTTVFIARGALGLARDEARVGCAAQDAQTKGCGVPAVGLHLLHAKILAAMGDLDGAVAELKRELAWVDSGQLFARECLANTWYVLGAVFTRQRKRNDAEDAFKRVLTIDPRHVSALAASRGEVPKSPPEGGRYAKQMDAAIAQAIVLARGNRHADAARVYRDAVAQAPPGHAGWMLAVEPTLNVQAHPEIWAEALALVADRAM